MQELLAESDLFALIAAWLPNIGIFLAICTLIAIMVWFMKTGAVGNGFVIHVDESDISFTGQFPPNMQTTVIHFLRQDVAIPGTYQIRGTWNDRTLVVVVKGDHARPMEQRIRNFLKLNLKPPR